MQSIRKAPIYLLLTLLKIICYKFVTNRLRSIYIYLYVLQGIRQSPHSLHPDFNLSLLVRFFLFCVKLLQLLVHLLQRQFQVMAFCQTRFANSFGNKEISINRTPIYSLASWRKTNCSFFWRWKKQKKKKNRIFRWIWASNCQSEIRSMVTFFQTKKEDKISLHDF